MAFGMLSGLKLVARVVKTALLLLVAPVHDSGS